MNIVRSIVSTLGVGIVPSSDERDELLADVDREQVIHGIGERGVLDDATFLIDRHTGDAEGIASALGVVVERERLAGVEADSPPQARRKLAAELEIGLAEPKAVFGGRIAAAIVGLDETMNLDGRRDARGGRVLPGGRRCDSAGKTHDDTARPAGAGMRTRHSVGWMRDECGRAGRRATRP